MDVVWQPPPGAPDANASASCVENTLSVNPQMLAVYIASPAGYSAVVRHEVGHLFGLYHTGTVDSVQDGLQPLLSTCATSIAAGAVRAQSADDVASIASHFASSASELNGNFGFENGTRFMSFTGVNTADTFWTTQKYSGSYGFKFRPATASGAHDSYMSTTANVESTPATAGVRVVATARSRKENAAWTGSTSVQLKWRTVNYPVQLAGCSYVPPLRDLRTRTYVSPWTVGTELKWAPTTTWSGENTSKAVSIDSAVSVDPQASSLDLWVLFRSYLVDGSSTVRANVDNFGIKRCDTCPLEP